MKSIMHRIILDRFTEAAEKQFKLSTPSKMTVLINHYWGEYKSYSSQTEYLSHHEISKGIGSKDVSWMLGAQELKYFATYEGVFLSLLSRFDFRKRNFTVEEMAEHYYRLINFWLAKLKEVKPTACFSLDIPHVPSSFALYLVNKYARIPHIYLDAPLVLNKFAFFACSFSQRSLLINAQGFSDRRFVGVFNEFAHHVRNKSPHAAAICDTDWHSQKSTLWKKLPTLLMQLISAISPLELRTLFTGRVKWRRRSLTETYWKANRRRWDDPKSSPSQFYFMWHLLCYNLQAFIARDRYRKLCTDYRKLNKFIYFAAPVEPEASTLPIALESRRLYPALRAISEALPDGVSLAFKENPVTFDARLIFTLDWKSNYYYRDLQHDLSNIVFISENVPTLDLIEKSIGVACINGTVGIESILKGKHCITFAPQWYDNASGIHLVKTPLDVAEAVDLMIKGEKPDPTGAQVQFSKCFFEFENFRISNYTSKDLKKITEIFWSSYDVFLNLDDRKWDV